MYSKDQPQIPTMMIDADAEGYTVTFLMHPGNPQPGDTVKVSIVIKHQMTGTVYTKPIQMSVSRVTFSGGEDELIQPTSVSPESNAYPFSYHFDAAEKYQINVTFEPRGGFIEKISFPVVIGKTNFSIIPILFGFIFLLTYLFVGFTKRRRKLKTA
jgi:hypothetical protein